MAVKEEGVTAWIHASLVKPAPSIETETMKELYAWRAQATENPFKLKITTRLDDEAPPHCTVY